IVGHRFEERGCLLRPLGLDEELGELQLEARVAALLLELLLELLDRVGVGPALLVPLQPLEHHESPWISVPRREARAQSSRRAAAPGSMASAPSPATTVSPPPRSRNGTSTGYGCSTGAPKPARPYGAGR